MHIKERRIESSKNRCGKCGDDVSDQMFRFCPFCGQCLIFDISIVQLPESVNNLPLVTDGEIDNIIELIKKANDGSRFQIIDNVSITPESTFFNLGFKLYAYSVTNLVAFIEDELNVMILRHLRLLKREDLLTESLTVKQFAQIVYFFKNY